MSNSWKMKADEKVEYFNFLREKFLADRDVNEHGDVLRIQIGNKEFTCHRYILAANSEYFAALFRNSKLSGQREDTMSLPSEHVNECIFSKILQSMYGEPLNIKPDDVIPIFSASLYLQLHYFVKRCHEYITNNVATLDVLELVRWPQIKFDQALCTFLKKFISKHFSDYALRMVELPLEIIEELLSNVEIVMPNKDFLIEFGRSWILYDLPQRKQYLRKIALILKPHHKFSDRSLELVLINEKDLLYHDVKIVLYALLDLPNTQYDSRKFEVDQVERIQLRDSLFFAQSNERGDSSSRIATFDHDEWTFFDSPKLPVASNLWTNYEGAVAGDALYISAEIKSTNSKVFSKFGAETPEWTELIPPEKIPELLISCNSRLYSYECSSNNNHFSYFEPTLNRWFKTPPVKHPRLKAGVTSDGSILYMVGGRLQEDINTTKNIVEMYDSRCGFWSCIRVEKSLTINYIPYNNRVCYLDNMLYLFVPEGDFNLSCFDIRNNKWPCFAKNALASDRGGYALTKGKNVWFMNENPTNEIRIYESSTCEFYKNIYSLNVLNIKPISLPYKM